MIDGSSIKSPHKPQEKGRGSKLNGQIIDEEPHIACKFHFYESRPPLRHLQIIHYQLIHLQSRSQERGPLNGLPL